MASRPFGSPPALSPSPTPIPQPASSSSAPPPTSSGPTGPPNYAVPPDIRAIINDRSWLHDEPGAAAATSVKYIVGIDYGTTFSGFGLHIVTDRPTLTRNGYPTGPVIKCYDNWEMQPPGLFSPKLPTISTYSRTDADAFAPPRASPAATADTASSSSSKLVAWGWRAASDFSGKDHKLALAKLALHPDTPPHRRPFIPAGLDLVDIVADYLRELVGVVRSLAPGVGQVEGETVWCFTVPVNWNAAAMDVMRQAAHRAGLIASPTSRLLRFCEEPEAAALTCLEESGVKMAPGARFLVVDAGGGTVDLFQCTLDAAGSLDEITVGAGDFLGASFVDARFYSFLRTHLGDDTWESLTTSPSLANTWRDMEARWENLKRTYRGPPAGPADPATNHEVLTFSLSLYKQIPEEFKAALRERQGTDDELWVTAHDMQSFFDPVVSAIRNMVLDQLRGAPGGAIDHVFFVGGFGANRYLQSALMSDPEIQSRVRQPTPQQIRQPESAVLKGAVRYGMDRGKIRTRMAKHTLALLVHVNANALPFGGAGENGLVKINGQTYLVLVRRGEAVRYESLVTHSHLALGDTSTTGVVKIFEIDGCLEGDGGDQGAPTPTPRLVGRITVTAPLTPGVKRRVTLLVNFGELELKMRAVSEVTGQEWRVTVQYDVTQDRQVGSSGSGAPAVASASSLRSLTESMSNISVSGSPSPSLAQQSPTVAATAVSASPELDASRRGSIPMHHGTGSSSPLAHQTVILNPPARSASNSAASSSPNLSARSVPPPASASSAPPPLAHHAPMMPAAPSPLAVAQAMQQGDSSASNRPFVIPVRETSVHAPPPAMPMQSPPTSSSFGRQPTAHYPSPAPQASGYYPNPTTSTSNSWPRHQHTPAHHHAPQHVFGVPDEFQHHPYYARSPPQHVRQVPPPPPSGANVFPPPRTTPVHASPGAGPGQPYAYPNTAAGGGGGYARQPVMLPGVPDPPVLPPVLPHQQQHIGVGARPSVVVQRSAHQQQQQQQPYSGGAYYGGQGHGQGGGGGYR